MLRLTVTSPMHRDALAVRADVTQIADLDQLFTQVSDNFGPVDVLFVNAGISRFTPLDHVEEAEFDEIMNANFKGAFFTIQRALPHLRDGASIIGRVVIPGPRGPGRGMVTLVDVSPRWSSHRRCPTSSGWTGRLRAVKGGRYVRAR